MSLTGNDLAKYIDHTLLKPAVTPSDIGTLCVEAVRHGFYGVCVNPSMIALAAEMLEGSTSVPLSVVGFPLGATIPESKAFETAYAVKNGAREIDMVLNLGAFKAKDFALVTQDIRAVVDAADGFPVKVILETAMLSDQEIVQACTLAVDAGARFVKTSTGFGPGGATLESVALMRKTVGPNIGVKASGGISTFNDAISMIEAGADRIGASASVAIVSA